MTELAKILIDTKIRPIRDAALVAIVVLAIASICNLLFYKISSDSTFENIQSELYKAATTAASFTDGDLHKTLTDPKDTGSETYRKVRKNYEILLKDNQDIRFIYTLVLKDEKAHFIIDSQTAEEERTGVKASDVNSVAAKVMDEYEATPTLIRSLKEHKALVEKDLYTDKWGTFISGYAPFYDSKGDFVGVAGVDIDLKNFNAQMFNIKSALILSLFVAGILSAAAFWVVYRVRNSQLKEFEKNANKNILTEEFNAYIKQVVAEVSTISDDFKTRSDQITLLANTSAEECRWALMSVQDTSVMFREISLTTHKLIEAINLIASEVMNCLTTAQDAYDKSLDVSFSTQNLVQVSGKISEVTDFITNLAGRINMLSLNAKIEAASAKDAGKGFNIVASEVKSLAAQTLEAAGNISSHVGAIQDATEDTKKSYGSVTDIIQRIKSTTENLTKVVEAQNSVVRSITDNISSVTGKTNDIVERVGAVSDIASKIELSTQETQHAVQELSNHSRKLNEQVDSFLDRITAD